MTGGSLPDFPNLDPADVVPAITELTRENLAEVEALLDNGELTFATLIEALEAMDHNLMASWSPVSHLQMVASEPEWRAAHEEALPLLSEYATTLGQMQPLYEAVLAITDQPEVRADPIKQTLLNNRIRDFRKAGVALPDKQKKRFSELMTELAKTTNRFAQNVQDATDQWSYLASDKSELIGLPGPLVAAARERAKKQEHSGYHLALDMPTYQAVMTLAESGRLRREFYTAWVTRASDQGPLAGQFDNGPLIKEILAIRHEIAQLTGFDSYADYALDGRMAKTKDEVIEFLGDLAERSQSSAHDELAAVEQFAGQPLEPWDIGYFAERLKEARFSISDELLKPYLPASRVVDGLFELATELYQISLTERHDVAVWHDDACYFEVANQHGEVIGGFYADLYAREGKRSGAWIDECRVRAQIDGAQSLPVGYLVCNFSRGSTDHRAELGHSEVVTLFHEFGHMMHHLLTRIDYPSISGINGVPWDAVELPSQFMENFAWEYSVLERLSSHRDSGEPLDRTLFEQLTASRQFNAGLAMLRQLEFALFDFRLHAEYQPGNSDDVAAMIADVRTKISLIPVPEWNRFANSFSHIFAGGYAAGYYSYKWAEVLAADAYTALDQTGERIDTETANRFRESILEVGGSKDILDAFVEFRGRPPSLTPLLLVSGIQEAE